MLNKVTGLARALAILLAVVSGFVAIPGLDVTLAIVVLSVIAGITMPSEQVQGTSITVLVLGAVGGALGNLPAVGAQLTAVAGNVALGAASAVGTAIAIMLFNLVKDDLTGLAK